MAIRTCIHCNKTFKAKYTKKKFCSKECLIAGTTKDRGIYVNDEHGNTCRICVKCCKVLPLSEFYIDSANNTKTARSQCKACMAARHKEYRKTDTWKAYNRKCKHTSGRYSNFTRRAIKSGKQVEITKEEFWKLVVKPCYYCNRELEKTGCGLDRIDSSKGYLLSNVVPCCKRCNQAKMDLSQEEFYQQVLAIVKNRNLMTVSIC